MKSLSVFSDLNNIKGKINNKKTSFKISKYWKFKQHVVKTINRSKRNYSFEPNDTEKTACQVYEMQLKYCVQGDLQCLCLGKEKVLKFFFRAFTLRSSDKKEVEEKEEEEGKKQIKPEEVMEQNNKSKYS